MRIAALFVATLSARRHAAAMNPLQALLLFLCRPRKRVLNQAHKHSIRNRREVEASHSCGCFCCLSIYSATAVKDWTDWPEGTNDAQESEHDLTAICPRCGTDAVIGSATGYPITAEFLRHMKHYWFKGL